MEFIVTGGRNYDDQAMVYDTLDTLKITLLIEGGATGADRLCREWAIKNKVPYVTVEADWKTHGRAAGPIRNKEMFRRYPDANLIAFPGGAGTAGCIYEGIDANRVVLQVRE